MFTTDLYIFETKIYHGKLTNRLPRLLLAKNTKYGVVGQFYLQKLFMCSSPKSLHITIIAQH